MKNSTKFDNRIGEVNTNTKGLTMVIVKYTNSMDVDVQFEDGTTVNCQYSAFKSGHVSSKADKLVCGHGDTNGERVYDANRKIYPSYIAWKHMIERCYSPKYQSRKPTYIGCTVSEEWLNYTNFKEWHDNNYYTIEGEIMCLDKDLLCQGNKVYCKEKCVYTTIKINTQKMNLKTSLEKVEHIRAIAETYYGKIPSNLYNVLMNCKVSLPSSLSEVV